MSGVGDILTSGGADGYCPTRAVVGGSECIVTDGGEVVTSGL